TLHLFGPLRRLKLCVGWFDASEVASSPGFKLSSFCIISGTISGWADRQRPIVARAITNAHEQQNTCILRI
ncbi:hypothetical protein GIB67_032057, partial [Kingdonia uniflora]